MRCASAGTSGCSCLGAGIRPSRLPASGSFWSSGRRRLRSSSVPCPSGRRCNSRKVVCVKAHRGFKSHRYRQRITPRLPTDRWKSRGFLIQRAECRGRNIACIRDPSQGVRYKLARGIDIDVGSEGTSPSRRLTGVRGTPEDSGQPRAPSAGPLRGAPANRRVRDPNANGARQLNKPTNGRHVPDPLSDRKARGLLLAFLAVVIVVLALATCRSRRPPSTDEPRGTSPSRLVDTIDHCTSHPWPAWARGSPRIRAALVIPRGTTRLRIPPVPP